MGRAETCYFCTSTFQLFPILALALERKEKSDLYIDPQFKGANEYAQRIREIALFENVYVIDGERIYQTYYTARSGLLNHFQIARSYFHVDEISRIVLNADVLYKHIFVSSRAYLPRMVILNHIRLKAEFKVFYFDDGVGSYFGNDGYKPRALDGVMRFVLFGRKANNCSYDKYLFAPDLYYKVKFETTD